MENLTMAQKIIRSHAGLDPLAGYALVVYEQTGASGEEFRGVLKPGARFKKPKAGLTGLLHLRQAHNYLAIAVNLAPELRFTFNEHFTLDDQLHEFDMVFELAYYVTDPETVATTRNEDPLRQLRDEVIRLIGRLLIRADWKEVRHNFRALERRVVADAWEELTNYATKLGFGLKDIGLRARLPEKEIEVDVLRENLTRQAQKHKIEQETVREKQSESSKTEDQRRQREHKIQEDDEDNRARRREKELDNRRRILHKEDEVDAFEQRRRLREGITEASITAFDNVAKNISTPAELQDGINVLQLTPGVSGSTGHANVTPPANLLGGHAHDYPPAGADLDWLVVLSQDLAEINRWSYPFEQMRAVNSAVLHIVAELLLDDHADEETLNRYANVINTLEGQFNPRLTAPQSRMLKKFKHYDKLRQQFK
jgi:hypothetical protein